MRIAARQRRHALGARPPRPSNYRVCHSLQRPASGAPDHVLAQ